MNLGGDMTVLRIKPEHEESQGKFVLINEEDFDPNKHELYEEKAPETKKDIDHKKASKK